MGVEHSAMPAQFTSVKLEVCAIASSNSSRAKNICGWDAGHPVLTV